MYDGCHRSWCRPSEVASDRLDGASTARDNEKKSRILGNEALRNLFKALCLERLTHTRRYELANIAKLLGLSDVDKVDWERFERADVIELMAMPAVRCRKPASQNFTLRILKGLCTEAYLNGLLAENRLEAIRNIRNVRGIRQTSRTVPTMNDVSAIIADCEKGWNDRHP